MIVLGPHCNRKFNEIAAARHIPQCPNIKNKPKTLRKGTGLAEGVKKAVCIMPWNGKITNNKSLLKVLINLLNSLYNYM